MTRLADLATIVAFHTLRNLPLGAVSAVGAALGHLYALNASLRRHIWFARTIDNMAALADVDRTEARRRVFQLLRNSGRVTAEFAGIDRISHARLRFVGWENVERLTRPAIIVSAHVGNWEIAGAALVLRGAPLTALYDPPQSDTLHRLARETRLGLLARAPGSRLIAASPRAARDLIEAASRRENLLIYIDEEKNGLVWCPPLGRSLPMQGNRVLAARLAVRNDMDVLPVAVRRVGGAWFEIIVEPPIPIDRSADSAVETGRVADEIAAVAERWVRADLTHWYWLPNLRRDRAFPTTPGGRPART